MKRAVLEFLEDVSIDCTGIDGGTSCRWYSEGQTTFVTIQPESDDEFLVAKDHCENDEIFTFARPSVSIVWSK